MMDDKMETILISILFTCIALVIIFTANAFLQMEVFDPVAADKANEICKERGYDQYKYYKTSLINPTTPIAIKCEYIRKPSDLRVIGNEI